MSVTKKTHRYTNATEVEEYHSGRYGAPGEKRAKSKKPTPEQMKMVNQKNKEKRCRRKMRRWFQKHDLWVTLTYARDRRPKDMKEAKDDFGRFLRRVRGKYQKRGYVLRWIRNIERGTRNAWHIHLLISRIPDADLIIAGAWEGGTVDMTPCYKRGEFRRLAAYLTKCPETDPRLSESSHDASRNLPLPKPEIKKLNRFRSWDEIRIPKGFYLEKDSYYEGINPVTGFPYREYTLLRIKEKEDPRREAARCLSRRRKGKKKKEARADAGG